MSNNEMLFVLGSSETALAVIRSANLLKLKTSIIDIVKGVSFWSRYPSKYIISKTDIDEIIAVIRLNGCSKKYLVATNDHWVRFIHNYRDRLSEHIDIFFHPSNSTLDLCADKVLFYKWCIDNNINTPKMIDVNVENIDDFVDKLPLIVRPLKNNTESLPKEISKVYSITDIFQLKKCIRLFEKYSLRYIVTESLLGDDLIQYSVPVCAVANNMVSFVAEKIRPLPFQCAVGTYVKLSPEKEVEYLAKKAISALDYFGIAEVEVLKSRTNGKVYLIEVNTRPWTQYALSYLSGYHFIKYILSNGSEGVSERVISGRSWISLLDDAYCCFSRKHGIVTHGNYPLVDYVATLRGANVFSFFDAKDPMPAVVKLFKK